MRSRGIKAKNESVECTSQPDHWITAALQRSPQLEHEMSFTSKLVLLAALVALFASSAQGKDLLHLWRDSSPLVLFEKTLLFAWSFFIYSLLLFQLFVRTQSLLYKPPSNPLSPSPCPTLLSPSTLWSNIKQTRRVAATSLEPQSLSVLEVFAISPELTFSVFKL